MSTEATITEQPAPPNQPHDESVPAGHTRPTPKKIFVFCDGTGNEFCAKAPSVTDTGGNSNVVKLYTALELNPTQIAYYHPGVGTMGDPTKKGLARFWSRIAGLAFGSGFTDNVLDAYRYLMQHYNAGDSVYIFGFSRGAYTARALAGFLNGYGLLCRGNEGHILYAWALYTAKLKKRLNTHSRTVETDTAFRDTFSHPDFMIHFLGLWDTVSSVGWVTTPLRLLHMAQNPSVLIGRHAVSVHERRCFYHDNLWGKPTHVQVPNILTGTPRGDFLTDKEATEAIRKVPGKDHVTIGKKQNIKQVWFPGVHSDVGGSYGQYQSGLANASLDWMIGEVELTGAKFDPGRKQAVLGIHPDEDADPKHLTDIIQMLYPRPTSSIIHKSLKGLWWVLEVFPHRYYNTDSDKKEILRIPWGAWRTLPHGAILHPSLLAKNSADEYIYNPPNLAIGKRLHLHTGPNMGYGEFEGPHVHPDWRQNVLLVFLVKTLLTTIPVLFVRLTLLRPWLRHLLRSAFNPQTSPNLIIQAGALRQTVLHPATAASAAQAATHPCLLFFLTALLWSILVAAALVLFWTLVRIRFPRN